MDQTTRATRTYSLCALVWRLRQFYFFVAHMFPDFLRLEGSNCNNLAAKDAQTLVMAGEIRSVQPQGDLQRNIAPFAHDQRGLTLGSKHDC
ncbi:hypothetical protein O9993_03130 [Vibrio lentus]|nr:hypothetical protein [Vibrio lentus]